MGKKVIAIDLNPLSRTAAAATVTIVDNIIRGLPLLTYAVQELKHADKKSFTHLITTYNNNKNLAQAIKTIHKRLMNVSQERKAQQCV